MNPDRALASLTPEHKIALCSGSGYWNTKDLPDSGVPSIAMHDGPHGLRKPVHIADHLGINESQPATCFPAACATACSWDERLLEEIGEALGEECLQEDTQVLLGPGANIKRNPLCGRNFEYFSEDPLLSGKLAAAWIRGLQSKGISACLKHFAANNTESLRMSSDSIADERALREIYLKSFEIAVKEGEPGTVMCAYNKLNGVYCSDNIWLMQDLLRGQWGFQGAVITDWGAMHDRIMAFQAGTDLEMPDSSGFFDQDVLDAVKSGMLAEKQVNRSAERILNLISQTHANRKPGFQYDAAKHHALARKAAAESAVLLKNEGRALPLRPDATVALIGALAREPRYQGAGSSRINPTEVSSVLDGFREHGLNCLFYEGYSLTDGDGSALIAQAVAGAAGCDAAVIVAGLPDEYESEGFDRDSLDLPQSHDRLIEAVSKANPNTIVVLSGGSPVAMPWLGGVKAVLQMYLSGQAGGLAAADLLCGSANPCGKLAESYPLRYEDIPSSELFGAGRKQQIYAESIFIGYRYFDTAGLPVLFPFGHGLSYSGFEYGNLRLSTPNPVIHERLGISLTVKNTSALDGAEIVQVYLGSRAAVRFSPEKELKAFTKVFLKAGEEKEISMALGEEEFSHWNPGKKAWVCEAGSYDILVAASSGDVRLRGRVEIAGDTPAEGAQPEVPDWYRHPAGKPTLKDFEALIGRTVEPQPTTRKGMFTLENSMFEMRESPVIRMMIRFTEKMIGKPYGGADYRNVHFKVLMETAGNTPMKSLSQLSPDSMPFNVASGLVELANGRWLRGMRVFLRKRRKSACPTWAPKNNELFSAGRGGRQISVLYYPASREKAPLLVDVHGGGFVGGHHYSDRELCMQLNCQLDINVASIEYRYAPEAVYPVATEDCMDALEGLLCNAELRFDRACIFLMGHSAGGNIVAGMSLLAAGRAAIRGQILNYPFLDAAINPKKRKYIKFSIPSVFMKYFNDQYFPNKATRMEPLASPIGMSPEMAKGIPPTLMITCSQDSLREDGLRYAKLLVEAGVQVRHVEFKGAVHGFIEMVPGGNIDGSWWFGKRRIARQHELYQEAIREICAFIRQRTEQECDANSNKVRRTDNDQN